MIKFTKDGAQFSGIVDDISITLLKCDYFAKNLSYLRSIILFRMIFYWQS